MTLPDLYSEFASVYPSLSGKPQAKITEDVETVIDLIEAHASVPTDPLVEIACGTAGHVSQLAESHFAIGLDISREMLTATTHDPAYPDLIQADFNKLPVCEVGTIVALSNILLHVKSRSDLVQSLESIYESLRSGGLLIAELSILPDELSDSESASTDPPPSSEEVVLSTEMEATVTTDPDQGRDVGVIQVIQTTAQAQYITHHYTCASFDGSTNQSTDTFCVKLFTLDELCDIFAEVGFTEITYDSNQLSTGCLITKKPN